MAGLMKIRDLKIDIPKEAKALAERMLKDLENSKRPYLEAVKTSLDNSFYNSKVGYLTPGDKIVRTELNVSSVQKLARVVFMLEIMMRNLGIGAVNTKRELYYICKGLIKGDSRYKPLDFDDQPESDAIIDFIGDMMKVYREELNCFANDRGGQTYSNQLIVDETMPDGTKATIDLSTMGTSPFLPKNRPQSLKLRVRKKVDFAIVVESEGTANTLHTMGFTKRNNVILIGAQGVPSNGVRGWCKLIQDQLNVPIYFWGDLDAYTMQNIFRTLKAGSAASLIRNADFSAPDVKFLGVLPDDVKRYDLPFYKVREGDPAEARALKKAKDALDNDPFFIDKKNKGLSDILRWLMKEKIRCEQQAYFSVNPNDPIGTEKIILEKIKRGSFV
jgi:DNA topoisomerase VI subunit A